MGWHSFFETRCMYVWFVMCVVCFRVGNLGTVFQAVELYCAELHISSAAVNRHLFIVWQSSHEGQLICYLLLISTDF